MHPRPTIALRWLAAAATAGMFVVLVMGAAGTNTGSALVLATHFGISLIAFASTFLSAAVVFERTRSAPAPKVVALPDGFQRLVIGVGLFVLGVVYLGAYVRHAGISLACPDWPLCNG